MQSYCLAAAGQMNTSRLVVRFRHGIYGAGAGLDETFGRIEAAETYKKITRLPLKITISDSRMRQLARHFKVTPREGILSDVVKQGRGERREKGTNHRHADGPLCIDAAGHGSGKLSRLIKFRR